MSTSRATFALLGLLPVIVVLAIQFAPGPPPPRERPLIVTTIQPLRAIVEELATGRADTAALVPPGGSPHSYALKPSDMAMLESAALLVSVDASLDGWIAGVSTTEHVALLAELPADQQLPYGIEDGGEETHDHVHGPVDPHFWTDPAAVKAVLPALVRALEFADPDGSELYRANMVRFSETLDALSEAIASAGNPVVFEIELTDAGSGRPRALPRDAVFLQHLSMQYFLRRAGVDVAGVIEETAGRAPSPQELKRLVDLAAARKVKAIFVEPQASRRMADTLAAETGLVVGELDPLGGGEGRRSYAEWARWNIERLREALSD